MLIDLSRIVTAEAQAEQTLTVRRAAMKCSRMQGVLALGEARWSAVMDYRSTATWAEQVVIDSAGDWQRQSENIAFFAYLLGLSDAEVDALFETAATIKA
ncbi:hypothetical protein GEU84_020745 [Fertoebacter nigrum]|uniref:Uncharacterized protein n=1 Tax=Fertoeibacter niger TaxID=2656921 RepID=A0A8X8HAK4_9RHOB|nr:hypothetical protein [Fertoeibacter niger]NUB46816.1 hypothetical protein [Fertoeibacter niger]